MESSMTQWEPGKWNVICDRCGKKFKSDEVQREWTGLIVCKDRCFETRHPQDFVRSRPDNTQVAFTRPEPVDQFVSVSYSCAAQVEKDYPSPFRSGEPRIRLTIQKGLTEGPVVIEDGADVIVICSWRIT